MVRSTKPSSLLRRRKSRVRKTKQSRRKSRVKRTKQSRRKSRVRRTKQSRRKSRVRRTKQSRRKSRVRRTKQSRRKSRVRRTKQSRRKSRVRRTKQSRGNKTKQSRRKLRVRRTKQSRDNKTKQSRRKPQASKKSRKKTGVECLPDTLYWEVLRNYQEWMSSDNHKRNAFICADFGGTTDESRLIAFNTLYEYTNYQFIRDMSRLEKCSFPYTMRIWAPGLRSYQLEWINTTGNTMSKLKSFMRKCPFVTIQLDMQFGDSSHAGILFLYPNEKKVYVYDPNGTHALLLQCRPIEFENLMEKLGLEIEYLQTPNCNFDLPSASGWRNIQHLLGASFSTGLAHFMGARKLCMRNLAQHGYCLWISLYVTVEALRGKNIHSVMNHVRNLSYKRMYIIFESFIAYLITLLSLSPEGKSLMIE